LIDVLKGTLMVSRREITAVNLSFPLSKIMATGLTNVVTSNVA
jgi:hypothetical protein